ncbi:hypothetical protein, conserved [Plasmodium gonderi]|uniref:Small subunit rRNA processing factor n=1 Tax=Plasmodium gonderi TaxID=77519 RepID=A0A1Y1JMC9_PLAGO|nr:hypothetical protein, conserved [Plasmodium gonderi]GAW83631.1 hypothetical protein, conserved [Plasmodium gonderi]
MEKGEERGAEEEKKKWNCHRTIHTNAYKYQMKGKTKQSSIFNMSMLRNSNKSGKFHRTPGKRQWQQASNGGRRKGKESFSYRSRSIVDVGNLTNDSYHMDNDIQYYYNNDSSAPSDGEERKKDNANLFEKSNINDNCEKDGSRIIKDYNINIDYVEYMNNIKNNEKSNLTEEKLENSDERDKMNNIMNDKQQHGVYRIFLLFSPLAITSIRNRSCIINADDHMTFLENKLKNTESSLKGAKNNKEKMFLKTKIDEIKNKLLNVRLDILFFTLLSLRDSIINKKHRLQIYIHTLNGLLIYVSPLFRVPRNFSLFKKVMLNLMKQSVLLDQDKQPLLKILPHPIKFYLGSSVCIGISNQGFPTDVRKLSEKIRETKQEYSFFLSLSNVFRLTHFIEIISKNESEFFPFDYVIRLSDLPLSTVAICNKLTHFLND